jgi:hypothetical protein
MTEKGQLEGGRGRRDRQEKEMAKVKMVQVVLQVPQPEYQLVTVAVRRARKKPNRETGIAHRRQTGNRHCSAWTARNLAKKDKSNVGIGHWIWRSVLLSQESENLLD